ncbi:sugar phosphate nucleotidyltransferase [Sulfurihydrogenibium sp.]|jgi:dTDP-glucose pyrophosphorylase|uniref:sugar phosphate nucleotidyltransferase n=1 Tax=Sulfurihydrogenibium sp. TaxID=2053621 RepID=UPI003D109D62
MEKKIPIKTDLEKLLITEDKDIVSALKKLNESSKKILLVVGENNTLKGTVTDGDIRRYILRTGKLEGTVKDIYFTNPVFILEEDLGYYQKIKEIFTKKRIELLPVLDKENKLKGYIEWSDLLEESFSEIVDKIEEDIPVVIMAGGKGVRMRPFTNVLPKPLIPLKDKTVVETIIEEFKKFGLNKFFLTLNYKGEIIEAYFKIIEKDYHIDFIWENEFLGTAGSLKFLEEKDIKENFIVSNCDIIVKANFKEVLDFHKREGAMLTSITSLQHFKIPYGVVEVSSGGKIEKITEKPEYTFQINTGVYILNKKALKYIPKNKHLDMPELINILLENKETVLAYPIKENDYIDLGQWEEYKKAIRILEEKV